MVDRLRCTGRSLVAASYLEARSRGGTCLVRMEDLDPPRCRTEAADEIRQALKAYGFERDGPGLDQTTRNQAYRTALAALDDWTYPYCCSRQDECDCRTSLTAGRQTRAVKVRAPMASACTPTNSPTVVDDAAQGVTDFVRGADLLAATPRQNFLQRCLGLPTPGYVHAPLVLNASGDKLSKQTKALPLDHPAPILRRALTFLAHQPPAGLGLHWDLRRLERYLPQWRRSEIPNYRPRIGRTSNYVCPSSGSRQCMRLSSIASPPSYLPTLLLISSDVADMPSAKSGLAITYRNPRRIRPILTV